MAKEYQASTERDARCPFACKQCGAHGEVTFRAIGRSRWVTAGLFNGDEDAVADAWMSASQELAKDTRRVLSLVSCRTCGHRAGRVGSALRIGSLVLATIALALLGGGEDGNATWGAIGLGCATLYVAYRELERLTRARVAVFTMFTRGTIPQPQAKPRKAALPTARAIVAPPPRSSPAPIVRPPINLTTSTIEVPPPPEDGGPRFLR